MRLWHTEFKAICASTGKLKTYIGEHVPGLSRSDAQRWCNENAGHLRVLGLVVMDIPCKDASHSPDWNKAIDYSVINNN